MLTETQTYAFQIVSALLRMGRTYTADLMEAANVPTKYGQGIVTKLASAGILETKKGRGRGCGTWVNPLAHRRSLADISRLVSPPRLPMEKAGKAGRILDGLAKGFNTRLETLTISDLLD